MRTTTEQGLDSLVFDLLEWIREGTAQLSADHGRMAHALPAAGGVGRSARPWFRRARAGGRRHAGGGDGKRLGVPGPVRPSELPTTLADSGSATYSQWRLTDCGEFE